MGQIEISWTSRLQDVPPETWDRLSAARTPFHRREWLGSAPAPGQMHLCLARRESRIVGALPIYVVDRPSHYYHSPVDILCGVRERHLLESIGLSSQLLQEAAGTWRFPCAIATVPYGYRSSPVVDACDLSAGEVMLALTRAAHQLCQERGIGSLLYYGLRAGTDSELIESLATQGTTAFIVGAHCGVDVHWSSLEDYFRSLGERGRRMRSKFRQAMRDPSVRWRAFHSGEATFTPELRSAAADLFAQSAQGRGDSVPPVELYRAVLAECWPARRHLLVAERPDGTLRSALLIIEDGPTLYPKFVGCTGRGDYFQLVFYQTIDLAISLSSRHIEYGGGSHEAKLLRGAELSWLLGAVVTCDDGLAESLAQLIPRYSRAKQLFFTRMMERYAAPQVAAEGFQPGSTDFQNAYGAASW